MPKDKIEEQEQSDFNSAIATLMRIDKIKKALADSRRGGDIHDYFAYLEAYFFELLAVMDDKDDTEQTKNYKDNRTNYQKIRKAEEEGQPSIDMDIIHGFYDWEMVLRNKEQSYGMNISKKSDPRYALAGR